MRKLFTIIFLANALLVSAQSITIENIYGGKYYAQSLWGINSMKNGKHYTILERDGLQKYSYDSFINQNEETASQYIVRGNFDDYRFSSDENYLLLASNSKAIYRHSVKAKWQVYDISNEKFQDIFDGKLIQEPTFSPDASKVAFAFENNLYYQDLKTNKVTQITFDGEKNKIINGICDWVYEEEFGFVRHFDWNSDGTFLAFARFDESRVKEFYIPIYGKNLYPEEMRFKYPKAGEENSKVSLHLYNVNQNKINNIDLSLVENYYIPKIKFTENAQQLAVLTSNRNQNKVDVSLVETSSAKVSKLFTETDKAWIDTDNLTLEFLEDNSFIWASERDGNRHIYYYGANGKLINQITKGDWEVTDYYGFDSSDNTVYFQSNQGENGKRISTERQVYKVNLNGKKLTALTQEKGTNSASFSGNFKYFINEFSSTTQAPVFKLNDGKKTQEYAEVLNNDAAQKRLEADNAGTKELFTITTKNGIELNAWIIKPKDFNPNKKYPLLMYQYSGPGSQEVSNSWFSMNDDWFFMLAQKGYLVACVDGRGTGYKGAEFKKSTYLNLGAQEVEDQINAAEIFASYNYIDKDRIGIWGWSYGGFMSSNAILKGSHIFKAAIAVAPVTNWRFYDTVYTERFMRTPGENPSGYDSNSPINFTENLKGKYLLIHGSADDNVHLQNSMEMAESLIQANKQFDMMIYPDKNHGIYGGNTRVQLYNKMTDFILNNL